MKLPLGALLVPAGAIALCACAPTPEGIARVKAEQQAFYQNTFLPGAPQPGDPRYESTACGGDHGMAQQWADDLTGYPRPGPPEMAICR